MIVSPNKGLIVSRGILQELRIQRKVPQERLPRLGWAVLLESVATLPLRVMLHPPPSTAGRKVLTTDMLIHEAPYPGHDAAPSDGIQGYSKERAGILKIN